jgi:hypothetical protein
MAPLDLRRKLAWLIGIRAVIGTVLLGGAIFLQITSPGSLPVDPFFFLIALTYALTAVYALTLRYVDRHRWIIDAQLASDALMVSAFIYFTASTACSRRSTCCRSSPPAPSTRDAAACWSRR